MIIVHGVFEVDPGERDAFLASRVGGMRSSRAEAGCLEYAFCADPLEPGRVVLVERWESEEALDAHLAAQRDAPAPEGPRVRPLSASIVRYTVSGESRLL